MFTNPRILSSFFFAMETTQLFIHAHLLQRLCALLLLKGTAFTGSICSHSFWGAEEAERKPSRVAVSNWRAIAGSRVKIPQKRNFASLVLASCCWFSLFWVLFRGGATKTSFVQLARVKPRKTNRPTLRNMFWHMQQLFVCLLACLFVCLFLFFWF